MNNDKQDTVFLWTDELEISTWAYAKDGNITYRHTVFVLNESNNRTRRQAAQQIVKQLKRISKYPVDFVDHTVVD